MDLESFAQERSGKTRASIFDVRPPLARIAQGTDAAGAFLPPHYELWVVSELGPMPTAPEIAAALASGPGAITLAAYAEQRHEAVLAGGISVDVGGGVHANVSTTEKGRGLVDGCVGLIGLAEKLGQPAPSFGWVQNDGATLTLSVAQIYAIALALGQFVQGVYAALGQCAAGIASGAITGFAGIDALPWPANS